MNGDNIYLDTSALLPYYREEEASHRVESLLRKIKPPVLLSELTRVEMASAIARWTRMNEISEPQAEQGAKFFSIPWRPQKPVTAGWIARGISHYFQGFPVRRLWDRKAQKMRVPTELFASDFKEAA